MIRILRLARESTLITAQVFEELFDRHFGAAFAVTRVPMERWCDAVLGSVSVPRPLGEAARAFAAATGAADFICPSWECIPLAPLFVALRNRSASHVRLLFIAHAAACYTMEWALLRPLLAPGDVVITPSESARATVEYLCPDLAPFLGVIPHPMEPLPHLAVRPERRVVSLGRINAEKLLHRQIEAMDVLRQRGRPLPAMQIGGALDDGLGGGPHPYARALAAKIERMRLGEHVALVGPVRGEAAKARFLNGAAMLMNLSVTLEESCPKTPIEALGVGVPVVGTSWNGLRDNVGPCGTLVPVSLTGAGIGSPDAGAEAIADAMEANFAAPPSSRTCREYAARFAPGTIMKRYAETLAAALDDARAPNGPAWPAGDCPAAPAAGLLSVAAPLPQFSFAELFGWYAESCGELREAWRTPGAVPLKLGIRLRAILQTATRSHLECFSARLAPAWPVDGGMQTSPARAATEPAVRLVDAATRGGLIGGRLASVLELLAMRRFDLARTALDPLIREGICSVAVDYLRAELALETGDPALALALSRAALRRARPVESESHRVRQIARIARRLRQPDAALGWLHDWLGRFPDSQESGPVWLDLCVNAARSGDAHADAAATALTRARALLGNRPVVERAGAALAAGRACAALAGAGA